ncbi:hypothetical protein LCGC14_2431830 [marine sediment metagenome]|uniref:Uncharacterized protein n=1 Tax=marine sediment metagenome TaxID=412755 RepID=A0A0F9EFN9_9ZZZZ
MNRYEVSTLDYLRQRLLKLFREKYHVPEVLINDFYDEWNRTLSELLYKDEDLRPGVF